MLDIMVDFFKGIIKSRLLPIAIIFGTLIFLLVHQIYNMQIINGSKAANEALLTSERTRDVKGTRGNIYDRYGKLLAYDELSYSVTIEDVGALTSNDKKNQMIFNLVSIIEENGGDIISDFPIKLDENGQFYFTIEGNALLRFKKDIYSLKASDKLEDDQIAITAEEMFAYIRYSTETTSPRFVIDESYSTEDALKIMSIRYELFLNRWQKYVQSTIAMDVNKKTVAAIKEYSAELPGVQILQETHRVYNDSQYFAHILGYTGSISSEEYDALDSEEEKKYTLTDQIGKKGLEKEYESYLHGQKGNETVIINENYRVIGLKNRTEPIAGNNLYLTIDADLQKKCYNILEKKIAGVLLANIKNSMDYGSKGTSSDKITIPIYEVYNALIENNVIDITTLNNDTSTDLEKSIYKKYQSTQKNIFANLDRVMAVDSTISNSAAGDDLAEYLSYIYTLLIKKEVLISDAIDKESQIYLEYTNNKISLSQFLQYALSNKWIKLDTLEIGDTFYSTEELYTKLLDYIKEVLTTDKIFNKKIYKTLIFNYSLTGKEICLLLFDQGVIEYDEGSIEKLENGTISAYDFMCDKIKKLQITPGQLALEPCSGSVVVTDVKTGDVLALVSYPSYDNNKLANQINAKYWAYLDSNSAYPMLNRPLQQTTAPGSTYKMVIATAALEEGIVGQRETVLDKVVYENVTQGPKCWSTHSHGYVDITDALQVSCNYFFYEMGYRLSGGDSYNSNTGLKKISKYASMFGFDAKSGIELYEYEPHISDEDSIRSSIGQGTNNYTPAQISRYVTTIANRGTCYDLTVVDNIKNLEGDVILDNQANVHNQMKVKSSTWNLIFEGMYKVANGPLSSVSAIFENLGVTVAGKTGTAQESKAKPNHALFVSFAPYQEPKISVTVVIPNGYSSSNSADVAKNIYKDYFKLSAGADASTEADTPDTNIQAFSD